MSETEIMGTPAFVDDLRAGSVSLYRPRVVQLHVATTMNGRVALAAHRGGPAILHEDLEPATARHLAALLLAAADKADARPSRAEVA